MSVEQISVIIPARAAPRLIRTLDSLLSPPNRERIAEIIVIDDGERAFTDPLIKHIRPDQPCTAPAARNIGIRAATGDWLAFIDADCVAAPDWLESLLKAAHRGYEVVGGGVDFGRTGYWAAVHNVSMLHEFHVSASSGTRQLLPTLNLLVRRRVIEQVGLMDEALRRAQDLEWTTRMRQQGFALWFEAPAAVTHLPARTRGSLWLDYRETGRISYRVRSQASRRSFLLTLPPLILRLLSPLLALAATLRIFGKQPALWRHLAVIPGVWLTKLAWCLGAADGAEEHDVFIVK
jgi:glycosyltransferase involved in cell wall biosynthesis